jgi:hypothetical protein
MVIAQVERSLKQFLEDNGEDIKEVILARFGSSDRKFNNSDPLGQLYWRELWDLASEYIHDNDRSKNIKALRKKAETDSAIKAGKEGNYPVILEAYLFREIGTEFESLVNSTFH